MSDNATLRRLLREHAEAVSTEIAIIKEDAILRLFDAVQNEYAAQVAALRTALEEEGRRNAVFTACLHKAQNLYLEAHPDYPGWPDGAVNITWVLEAFDKERAEVKRLQAALDAAINMNIEKNAEVIRLTAALREANEALKFAQAYWMQAVDERDKANADAERLDKLVMDAICRQTSEIDTNAGLDAHRTHIARVRGAS